LMKVGSTSENGYSQPAQPCPVCAKGGSRNRSYSNDLYPPVREETAGFRHRAISLS
jgi:hypothetical protein